MFSFYPLQQVSTDGERNNERQFSQSRRRLQNASFNRTESDADGKGARERRVNRNNNMDYAANRESGVSVSVAFNLLFINFQFWLIRVDSKLEAVLLFVKKLFLGVFFCMRWNCVVFLL